MSTRRHALRNRAPTTSDTRHAGCSILPTLETGATEQAVVWIGVVAVTPREGCDLLSPQAGAFVNFLTIAASELEYRAKVVGALSHYRLDLLEFQDVRRLSVSDEPSEEIRAIAAELKKNRNPEHVRFATFHTFPRLM